MQCYYPGGQPNDGLSPCNTTASVSSCCRVGDICLTNGYCFSTGLNSLVRRGCTDKTFNSTACAQSCTTGSTADVVLIPCDTYTNFCCGQDQAARNCCSTGTGIVHIPAGAPIISSSAISSIATITIPSTATSTSLGSAISTAVAAPSDCESQKNVTIGVGAGLGVLLVLAAIGTTSFWYLWRRTKGQIRSNEGQIARLQDRIRVLTGPLEQ